MTHPYPFGATVVADASGIPMLVVSFEYRPNETFVQCAYWLNGEEKVLWLPLWRTKLTT